MITIDLPSGSSPPGETISRPSLQRFLRRASTAVGVVGTVDVLLSSDAELKRLNRSFRGKNKATDVLSFPADPMPGLPVEHRHAGDLAVSIDTAVRQAEQHGHSLATELRILLLHGLLHLAGMDHEVDAGEMAMREAELRRTLRLPTSLIERTHAGKPTPARREQLGAAPRALQAHIQAQHQETDSAGAKERGGR